MRGTFPSLTSYAMPSFSEAIALLAANLLRRFYPGMERIGDTPGVNKQVTAFGQGQAGVSARRQDVHNEHDDVEWPRSTRHLGGRRRP